MKWSGSCLNYRPCMFGYDISERYILGFQTTSPRPVHTFFPFIRQYKTFINGGTCYHPLVFMLIRPTGLTLVEIFFWIVPITAMQIRLISIKTKEHYIWPPLWKRSIIWTLNQPLLSPLSHPLGLAVVVCKTGPAFALVPLTADKMDFRAKKGFSTIRSKIRVIFFSLSINQTRLIANSKREK